VVRALANEVAKSLCADLVQQIGKVIVLYLPNTDARPALSNITRLGR